MSSRQDQFNLVNHTYTHLNLDNVQAQPGQFTDELTRNENVARQQGFMSYWHDTFMQPDISGLSNPTFQQAAYNWGIRYMISDTSQRGWKDPLRMSASTTPTSQAC